jgi:hypothetical protein
VQLIEANPNREGKVKSFCNTPSGKGGLPDIMPTFALALQLLKEIQNPNNPKIYSLQKSSVWFLYQL